jgi:hypothetical protein
MRSEAIYTDADRQNWDWEGIWNAAARRDGEGWTAESAIPLKTLSFDHCAMPGRQLHALARGRQRTVRLVSPNHAESRARDCCRAFRLHQGYGLDTPGLPVGASRNYATDEKDEF